MLGGELSRTGRRLLLMSVASVAAIGASGAQAKEKANAQPSIWEQEMLTGDRGAARAPL